MKKPLSSLLILLSLTVGAFADEQPFKSRVIAQADPMDFVIHLMDNRFLQIVNFVQDQDSTSTITVLKEGGGATATVLKASYIGDQMSAQDKNLRIVGPATVTVTKPAIGNAFITYRVVRQ